jgi:maltokinase
VPVDVGTVQAHLRGRRWYAGEAVTEVVDLGDLGEVRHVLAVVGRAAYQCFLDGDGEDAVGDPAVVAALSGMDDPPGAKPLGVEQSNTSLVLEDGSLAKIFRRLHHGPNPDVEVPRVLGERRFSGVVSPLHTWQQDGWDLGVIVPFLEGATDGWDVALGTADPAPLAFELGTLIAGLHAALAGAFGATPSDPAGYVDVYEQAVSAAGALPDPVLRGRLRSLAQGGACLRVHGDLHLGQLLLHAGTWRIIDFEGEPDRSLEERIRPASPLKDVAGMIRSFAYAAAVAGHPDDWQSRAVDAFQTAYLTSPAVDGLLPSDPEPVLDAYILEKAVYELAYERGHRPDWAWIPQAAIDRLIGADR